MRVAIVGAGIAGLSAARALRQEGAEVVLFEAAERVGGRVATYARDGWVADMGLQTFTPRRTSLQEALDLAGEEAREIPGDIYLQEDGRVVPGSEERNREPRYTFLEGNHRLLEILAQGLEVRLSAHVDAIGRTRSGEYAVMGEPFDGVILTPPLPDSARLLETAGDRRNLGGASYRSCISVALGYGKALSPRPYYALLSLNRMDPVLWLSIEQFKCAGRCPEGSSLFVVQTGPSYSRSHFDRPDEDILRVVAGRIESLFGPDFEEPLWHHIVRWKRSQPERVVLFENANANGGRLVVAGDGTLAGRAENAYETGKLAAHLMLERLRESPA
ncbi:MAG: FAD-dependent oxidoreductase [Fimbriimonadales bacterium]|nr:MAG: FAD-dependent oxidoreductase [Fimbriimonadales bacterium]